MQFFYLHYQTQENKSQMMTIPTRPAPPPPNRNQLSSSDLHYSASSSSAVNKKPAPPRPPPPKVTEPLKKSGSQKSISILSNLFGASSKNSNKISDKLTHTSAEQRIPPKIPAPPVNLASRHHHHHEQPSTQQQATSDVQLINFDEWPSSPPSVKKSNTGSDSVSMDSFCSSNSSPNNLGFGSGTTSQAER